jgi:hypothetical protein
MNANNTTERGGREGEYGVYIYIYIYIYYMRDKERRRGSEKCR